MIRAVVLFGAGYVFGTKAGKERYDEIRVAAQKAAAKLEQGRRPTR